MGTEPSVALTGEEKQVELRRARCLRFERGRRLKHMQAVQWHRAMFIGQDLHEIELSAKIFKRQTCRAEIGLQLSYGEFATKPHGFLKKSI